MDYFKSKDKKGAKSITRNKRQISKFKKTLDLKARKSAINREKARLRDALTRPSVHHQLSNVLDLAMSSSYPFSGGQRYKLVTRAFCDGF